VWRRHYPYYVNKTDEWDIAARKEKPTNAILFREKVHTPFEKCTRAATAAET
jgi:hypothetical protein